MALNMSLSLTPEKLMKVTSQCLEMYKTEKVSILHLTKLIGLLSATCITSVSVFTTNSGRSLSRDPSYQYQVTLNSSAKK